MKNLAGMMKQASQMQTRMREAQDNLARLVVEGDAGNGLVRVCLTGKGVMQAVKIDPQLADASDMETLQDLVMSAHNHARAKVDALHEEEMTKVTGGIKLPPGLEMPF